ncbi:hypothetical protein [Streptomyces durhamensis]|uniref:hypothetical protein n=1 Tax=Streptomyces durhamensis TaxID=68194 RepID=UPI0012FF0AEF|nr:hypothetical protein [Streptomyces durhamensis]
MSLPKGWIAVPVRVACWTVLAVDYGVRVKQTLNFGSSFDATRKFRGGDGSLDLTDSLALPVMQNLGGVRLRGLIDGGMAVGAQQDQIFVMRPVLTGDYCKWHPARAIRGGGYDVREFAEIDVEVIGEQVLSTPWVTAIAAGVSPETPAAVYIRADPAGSFPHSLIHLDLVTRSRNSLRVHHA